MDVAFMVAKGGCTVLIKKATTVVHCRQRARVLRS